MDFLFPYQNSNVSPAVLYNKEAVNNIEELLCGNNNVVLISSSDAEGKAIANSVYHGLNEKNIAFCIEFDLLNFFNRKAFLLHYLATFKSINEQLNHGAILPLQIDYERLTSEEIINLPELLARAHNVKLIIFLYNFHSILSMDNCDDFLYEFEKNVSHHLTAQYFFSSSMVNKMKHIFSEKKYFFNFAETINLPYPTKNEAFKYLEHKFITVGKEIKRDISDLIYDMCGGNPWYIMQLATDCHNITPGYVTKKIVDDSMSRLLNRYEAQFKETLFNLTESQFNLLLAVLDNVKQFSSAQAMAKYHLNTSAHIARSRDALLKKEIISFNDKDEAYFINPLFEYWLRNCYLAK